MLIPVRCISCGTPIAHLWEEYRKRTDAGEPPGKVLDDLGIKNMCCRAVFLGHADIFRNVAVFRK